MGEVPAELDQREAGQANCNGGKEKGQGNAAPGNADCQRPVEGHGRRGSHNADGKSNSLYKRKLTAQSAGLLCHRSSPWETWPGEKTRLSYVEEICVMNALREMSNARLFSRRLVISSSTSVRFVPGVVKEHGSLRGATWRHTGRPGHGGTQREKSREEASRPHAVPLPLSLFTCPGLPLHLYLLVASEQKHHRVQSQFLTRHQAYCRQALRQGFQRHP